ncbi:endonuclease/exonuclease/phosphatase family protein [Xylanibacter muris]|nr:endonuclease/exonuclease/phosphatase family protein [Xylanibacter muris]
MRMLFYILIPYYHTYSLQMLSLILTSLLTFVELNCENLFDTRHDSQKNDTEYLPESTRHWTRTRYWNKINNIAREIISCGEPPAYVTEKHCDIPQDFHLPDIVALCEVENDSVMNDLTKRSLLRNCNYDYVMTSSEDERGIDVALMYHKFTFRIITHYPIRVPTVKGMRKTRDILYVKGQTQDNDTLHIFVVHAPSRFGGERKTRPFRMAVAERLSESIDSAALSAQDPNIIVAGDFNDGIGSNAMKHVCSHGMTNITHNASGAKGTYRYKGKWERIDHILGSRNIASNTIATYIHCPAFLVEEDTKYGGTKPRRTYNGYRYSKQGFSDHLPLVAWLRLGKRHY